MLYVQHIYEEMLKSLAISEKDLTILFCGDFNSVPECGIYKLMTDQFVGPDFVDFQSSK